MKEQLNRWNTLLKGFRTVLLAVLTWVLMFIESLANALTGFSSQALKGAAIMAGVIVVKQAVTDMLPKIRGRLQK